MAYLGRQGVTAPLTSADIPDNSITTAKIVDDNVTAAKIPAGAVSSDVVYLENNTSTQDLSGTYSTERLYFNDSYQLTGDVTVTGHLALGSIADEDVVITQDSTERTITGSGTLEAGNVLQDTHRTSLTDMTGELGSVVTGSPNLNLGNATFPAGHVVNSWFTKRSNTASLAITSSMSWTSTGATADVTVTAGNDLLIWYTVGAHGTSARHWATAIKFDGNIIGHVDYGDGIYHGETTTFSSWVSVSNQTKITIASSGTFPVDLMVYSPAGTITIANDGNLASGMGYDGVRWMALEIQR
jgi:hypothetical protein